MKASEYWRWVDIKISLLLQNVVGYLHDVVVLSYRCNVNGCIMC